MKKFLILILISLFIPSLSLAAGLVPCGGGGEESSCELCHLFVMLDTIVDFIMLRMVPIIAVLLLVIAGVGLITSSGNPDAMKKAQKAITGIVIGLLLIYGSWIIVNTLVSATGLVSWKGLTNGMWSVISCQ